ncbi:MAG: TfoX/Sxy family DNA transformation protein [Pseudomonadota bacterium]
MKRPVSAIRNLGPKSDESFARAGITSAEQVEAMGADETYATLLTHGAQPHFIAYYALVMGLQGRPWNNATPEEKVALRARFDALKAAAKANPKTTTSALDRALAEIGVIDPSVVTGQPTSSRPAKK